MLALRLVCAAVLALLWVSVGASAAVEPASAPAAESSEALAPAGYKEQLAAYFASRTGSEVVEKDADRMTRLNLQIVQQAIERWAMDHAEVDERGFLRQHYPASISQLVQAGYLSSGLYPNACTASGPEQLNAVEVPFGWTPQAPGNFSYLADLRSASQARSYVLVGYSVTLQENWDPGMNSLLNGICCQLSSEGRLGNRISTAAAMWQGGRSYNIGLLFGAPDNATAEFFYNKRQGRVDSAAAIDLAKQDLHALQLAIERFSVDYSPPEIEGLSWDQQERRYPEAISALVQETYCLAGFYANPFTASNPIELNARELPFGWTEEAPGNFSYLKHYSPAGQVDGYVLILYADRPEAGHDIDGDGKADGTALVLTSMFNLPDGTVPVYSGSQRVNFQWSQPQDQPAVKSSQ